MKLCAVKLGLAAIVAALVPDEAAHRHRRVCGDHSVVEDCRLLDVASDRTLPVGLGLPVRLHWILSRLLDGLVAAIVAAPRRPCVDVRTAPARVEDADRDIERKVEFTRIVERDGREPYARATVLAMEKLKALRSELAPIRRELHWLYGPPVRALHIADVRKVGHRRQEPALHVAVARAAAPDRALHVALAGGEPHLANEDVLDFDGFTRLEDGDLHRAAFLRRLHRIEIDLPMIALQNFTCLHLPCKLNTDIANFPVSRRRDLAPDRDLHPALQDRAVRKRSAHLDFREYRKRGERRYQCHC